MNILSETRFRADGGMKTVLTRRKSNGELKDRFTIDHEAQTVTIHKKHGRDDVVVPLDRWFDDSREWYMEE